MTACWRISKPVVATMLSLDNQQRESCNSHSPIRFDIRTGDEKK